MSKHGPETSATPERRVAHDALVRIDRDGAWVAPALDAVLRAAELTDRERRQATELVYAVTRQRRRLDYFAAAHIEREPDPQVRAALRIGTLQLVDQGVEAHAAVSQAVALVPRKARGFVNAILRRVASQGPVDIPDPAVALSYPDWLVAALDADLGEADSRAALAAMNQPSETPRRADGYRQDPASGWVVDLVDAQPGDRIADLCAAPGGKATGLALGGADVVAFELEPERTRRLRTTADEFGDRRVTVVVADAARPPARPRSFDRVLLDAPCSGLGALRRRADARWRIDQRAIDRLAALQIELLDAAADLVVDGGRLVYSVCTVTRAETVAVVGQVMAQRPELTLVEVEPADRWRRQDPGVIVLPHDHATDGMFAAVFRIDRTRQPDPDNTL